jgi:hypothetical protein
MPGFDDRLTRELERAARPASPTGAFEQVERKHARRGRLRKVQAGALTVVVLAGTLGGVLVLREAIRPSSAIPGSSPTIGATSSPTAAPSPTGPVDIGLAFPVCDVQTMTGDVDGNGTEDTVYTATKLSDATGCPAPGTATEVLAVDLNGDGKVDASGGPPACPTGCEPFATPDVNGDGIADIAIVVERPANGTVRIQLWGVTTPPGGSLAILPFTDASGMPATFSWGSDGTNTYGVSCTTRTTPPLVTEWQAIPTGPSSWHVSEHGYHVVDPAHRSAFEDSYDVPGEETVFPDGGGSTMCGASVWTSSPPSTAPTTTSGPVVTSEPGPVTIAGVPRSACDVTRVTADLWGSGGVTAYVYRADAAGGCPAPADVPTFVALAPAGRDATQLDSPIPCPFGCRIFGAPDVDGDGRRELAIAAGTGTSSWTVSLFTTPADVVPVLLVPWGVDGLHPVPFLWDRSADHPAGAFCNPSEAGAELVIWHATPTTTGYQEQQRSYHLDGTTLVQPVDTPVDVPADEPALPSTADFCGAPVNA